MKRSYSAFDVQCRLLSLGFAPGALDGVWGPKTTQAERSAMEVLGVDHPDRLFHPSRLHRVILHWTAGAYGQIALERRHYHLLIASDGRAVMGDHAPEANANCADGRYSAHTRALNTGSIGVAVDAMGGANEKPFDAGPYPITKAQVDGLAREVAELCATYDIPVSRYSVLTHAEVQPTLGIWQRNKWDICWIPGMASAGPALKVGDTLRRMIAAELPR